MKIKSIALLMALLVMPLFADLEWKASDGSLAKWSFVNYNHTEANSECIRGTTICEYGKISPFLYSPDFKWTASNHDAIELTIWLSRASSHCEILFKKDTKIGYDDRYKNAFSIPGGQPGYAKILVPISHPDWNGTITNVRLCFIYEDDVDVEVSNIKLVKLPENIAAASDANVIEWKASDLSLSQWTFENYTNTSQNTDCIKGNTVCELGKISPFLYSPNFSWTPGENDTLVINVKCGRAASGGEILFKHSPSIGYDDALKVRFNTPGGNGEYATVSVPMKHALWQDKITNLRICFIYEDNVPVEVSSIKLMHDTNAGNTVPNGNFEMANEKNIPQDWQIIPAQNAEVGLVKADFGQGNALRISGKATLTAAPAFFNFLDYDIDEANLSLKAMTDGKANLKIKVDFEDALENVIAGQFQVWELSPTDKFQIFRIPRIKLPLGTARAILQIEADVQDGKTLLLDDACIIQKALPKSKDWSGQWISTNASKTSDNPPRTMLVRKNFQLSTENLLTAWLAVNCDDEVKRIFINGTEIPVGTNAKVYNVADLHRIDELLHDGENSVAIEGFNFNILGGLIAEITAIYKDGTLIDIGTDDTWTVADGLIDNWFAFDMPQSSKWHKPVLFGKGLGCEFAAVNRPQPSNIGSVDIEKFVLQPVNPSADGASRQFAYRLECTPSLAHPVNCSIVLKGNPQLHQPSSFILATTEITPDENAVAEDLVELPDFIPEGSYSAVIEADVPIFKQQPALTVQAAPQPALPDSHITTIIDEHYAPAIQMGDNLLNTTHHWCGSHGDLTEEKIGFCRDGAVSYYVSNNYWGWGWRPDGEYDFSVLDDYFYKLLSFDHNARIHMQIAVDPYHNYELKDWMAANPGEAAALEDGTTILDQIHSGKKLQVVSHASKPWIAEMTRALNACRDYIKNSPYGHRIIGLQPISGMGGEWYSWGTFDTGSGHVDRVDYSQPAQQYFREFLQRKYGDLQALNAKWHTDYSAWDEISVPSVSSRDTGDYFGLYDPQKSMMNIDYRSSVSHRQADAFLAMCDAVKGPNGNEMLGGGFYGYITYVADPLPMRAEGGHMALGKVLHDKRVDYLTHLLSYSNRTPGEPGGFMTPEASLLFHGKIPYVQADIRTYRFDAKEESDYGTLHNLQECLAVIKRDMINCLVSGVGYEFGYYGHGWIAGDRRMMQVIRRGNEIEAMIRDAGSQRVDPAGSIAVIVDDVSDNFLDQNNFINDQTTKFQFPDIYRIGCGQDTWLLEDIGEMPEYKCYLFLNTFQITPEEEEIINNKLKKNGATVAFIYAPGLVDENSLDTSRVERITGIKMDLIEKQIKGTARISDASHPILAYVKPGDTYGSGIAYGPVFSPQEGTILASANDIPVAAVKKFDDHTVFFSSVPQLSARLLRGIACHAGVHSYNPDSDDCTYATDDLFGVHTLRGGLRTFKAPERFANGYATELFTGKTFKLSSDGSFDVIMEPVSTVFFRFSHSL